MSPPLARLRLLACALSGRTLDVATLEGPGPAWTDGSTVFLDPDAAPLEQRQALAVQASLIRAGSLDPEILDALGRRTSLIRRYLAVEAHRALAANEELLPASARTLIDRTVVADVLDPADSLARARRERGRPELHAVWGELRPRHVRGDDVVDPVLHADQVTPPSTSSQTTLELLGDESGMDDDPRYLANKFTSPVGGGGPVGRLLQRLLTSTRSRGKGGGPVGADAPTHFGSLGEPGRGAVTLDHAAPDTDDCVEAPPGERTYPEWDEARGRYRPAWCTVLELEPETDRRRPMELPNAMPLRRPLARLGIGLVRQRRMPQGDDIDLDAAIEARIDALAGSSAPDGVYVETLRHRRDLSVVILLDISGSAGESAPGGRSVHEHQRAAAGALTAALHGLGDRVGLYAFNSRGRTAVQLTAVKRFDRPFDSRVLLDLGGLEPGAYTRLGAAIRHGTTIVERDGGTPRRLLVMLSDGFAYDSGYEGRYGEADARQALTEARRRGVGCICLSVGIRTAPAALRRVFGTASHASVPSAEHLSVVVAPLFRSAIRSAEAQRRTFQREDRTRERLELEKRST